MAMWGSLADWPNKQSYRHGKHKYEKQMIVMLKLLSAGQAQLTLHVYLLYFHRKLSNCFFRSFEMIFVLLLTLKNNRPYAVENHMDLNEKNLGN